MNNTNLPNSKLTPSTRRAQAFKHIGSHTQKAAAVSKLIGGNMPHHQPHAPQAVANSTSQSDMIKMSQEQQQRIIDNENACLLMPEIEWACRVLISSILSPKDMTKRELIYNIDIDWMSPTVKSVILDEIKKEMETVYDYSDSLYYIFKDALFTKGSHPRIILPEAAIDQVINAGQTLTMEQIGSMFEEDQTTIKSKGYFGPLDITAPAKLTMESYRKAGGAVSVTKADERIVFNSFPTTESFKANATSGFEVSVLENLTITDNYEAIKMAPYMEAISESRREELAQRPSIDFGDFEFPLSTNESFSNPPSRAKNSGLTTNEFKAVVYKSAPNNMVTHLRIPGRDSLKRRSVGRPLVISGPPEAFIPLHVPGNVRRKIGAIVILDENGHPISLDGADQIISRAHSAFNAMNSQGTSGKDAMGSMILSKAARNLTGGLSVTTFRDLTKIFEQLVEENIVPRLMNGAYPSGVEMADTGDLYTLMLARVLCSMRTRMVFIPAEMFTYFAFDYHSNGMGKSLLDSNKMLIAFRAGMLLARTNGEIRNSIPLTKVTMKIDEDDADWEKTFEETQDIISKTRQPQYPLDTLAVNDLLNWINRAGFVFAFEGHPRIPDTGFSFEKLSHDNPLPSQELYDSLGKQLYMGFGIPPELMDSTYDPEFAIAVASRNIMFTQTILESQKIASGLITDDHRKLILSDGIIMNMIVGMVRSKWGEITSKLPQEDQEALKADPKAFAIGLVKRIVNSIVVTLPQPDATTLENQRERYNQFKDFVEDAFPNFASEDVISPDIAPELSQRIGSMTNTLKSGMMRKWMGDNNIMPELFNMSAVDEEGKPKFDILKMTESYTAGLVANLMAMAKAIAPQEVAVSKDNETLKLGSETTADSSSGGFGGGGGDSSFGGGFGGDGGGGDDFDLDLDIDTSATNPESQPGEAPAEEAPMA